MNTANLHELATIMSALRQAHFRKDLTELRENAYQLIEFCECVMDDDGDDTSLTPADLHDMHD